MGIVDPCANGADHGAAAGRVRGAVRRFAMAKDPVLSASFLHLRARSSMQRTGDQDRHLFFWARNAIFYSLRGLDIPRDAQVLLPAYICSAAVEPIRAYGAKVGFYGVTRECVPDFRSVECAITPSTRAILLVHYFGFPADLRRIRQLCDTHGLRLIEDGAHVLPGTDDDHGIGSAGDATVFSWRKFLPLHDGAELVFRAPPPLNVPWSPESVLFTAKTAKYLVDTAAEYSSNSAISTIAGGLRLGKALWSGWRRNGHAAAPGVLATDNNSVAFDPDMVNARMSRLSRWILTHSPLETIRDRRRQNYAYLLRELSGIPGVRPLHAELPERTCPWIFPVFFDGLRDAHLRLREAGIPAVTWGGVRPAALGEGVFPDADFLYSNLVFLPVHQCLTTEDLQIIVRVVRQICDGGATLAGATAPEGRTWTI